MSPTSVLFIGVGVVGLMLGAEWLVRGAARVAARTGMSSVVIGLTVVAFGTSSPELAVSLGDIARGGDDVGSLALGNVVGSNIANVLFALGLSAAVGGSLLVARRIVRIDVPIMIGASVLVLLMSLDGSIGRLEGGVLVAGLAIYLAWTIATARRNPEALTLDPEAIIEPDELDKVPVWRDIALILGGLVLLVVGSQALVNGATDIATDLGVSDLVIGLTVVAIGTSLPEVATSVLAAIKGERDLAVGNAIGSNLYNLLAVLGVTAALAPQSIPVPDSAVQVDLPVMVAVAVACLPIFANGHVLLRWEGALFVVMYLGYIGWLVVDATAESVRNDYSAVMLFFVVPLSVITLAVVAWQSRHEPSYD